MVFPREILENTSGCDGSMNYSTGRIPASGTRCNAAVRFVNGWSTDGCVEEVLMGFEGKLNSTLLACVKMKFLVKSRVKRDEREREKRKKYISEAFNLSSGELEGKFSCKSHTELRSHRRMYLFFLINYNSRAILLMVR